MQIREDHKLDGCPSLFQFFRERKKTCQNVELLTFSPGITVRAHEYRSLAPLEAIERRQHETFAIGDGARPIPHASNTSRYHSLLTASAGFLFALGDRQRRFRVTGNRFP